MLPNSSAVSAAFLPRRPSVTSLTQYSARKARGLSGCPVFPPEPRARFLTCAPLVHSGPIRAYILAHKDAIQLWRTVMGPTRVFRARHVAPDSIRGRFGLTDTRNTTHGSGEAASCVHRIQREFGSRTLGRLGGGVERQGPQGAFLPVGFLALCGDLGRCGPGLWGGRSTGSEADYECFLRLLCTPYENPFSFSPPLQTQWFQPVERLQPSSPISVNSAGTSRRSPSCAVALCTTVLRVASTLLLQQEARGQPDTGL